MGGSGGGWGSAQPDPGRVWNSGSRQIASVCPPCSYRRGHSTDGLCEGNSRVSQHPSSRGQESGPGLAVGNEGSQGKDASSSLNFTTASAKAGSFNKLGWIGFSAPESGAPDLGAWCRWPCLEPSSGFREVSLLAITHTRGDVRL